MANTPNLKKLYQDEVAELLHQSRSDLVLVQLLQVRGISHFESFLLS